VVGLLCNLMIRPVAEKYFMTPEELAREKQLAHEQAAAGGETVLAPEVMARIGNGGNPAVLWASWAAVIIPLVWGISITLQKSAVLFK
jgi:hypothetical protein